MRCHLPDLVLQASSTSSVQTWWTLYKPFSCISQLHKHFPPPPPQMFRTDEPSELYSLLATAKEQNAALSKDSCSQESRTGDVESAATDVSWPCLGERGKKKFSSWPASMDVQNPTQLPLFDLHRGASWNEPMSTPQRLPLRANVSCAPLSDVSRVWAFCMSPLSTAVVMSVQHAASLVPHSETHTHSLSASLVLLTPP